MDDFILSVVNQLGLVGIAILMALENVFPPLPSEAIMGSAALAIHRGTMEFWPVLIAGTVGTVAGNYFWFAIGYRLGYERTRPFIERWGRWLTVEWHDVEIAVRFFRRHGHWVVLALRASPFMRTVISLPAGLARMGLGKFLVFTGIGAAVWNVFLILGTQWLLTRFPNSDDIIGWILIAITVIGAIGYAWRFATWRPRAERSSGAPKG